MEVMFTDGLSAEEAEVIVVGENEGVLPEASEQYFSSLSDEFYDVYSDAYCDSGTP
jgi:hypothetical protein